MELDVTSAIQSLSTQNTNQLHDFDRIRRAEERKTTALELHANNLQNERSQRNLLRKQVTDVLSDAMTVLKKSGDEIRQSSKG